MAPSLLSRATVTGLLLVGSLAHAASPLAPGGSGPAKPVGYRAPKGCRYPLGNGSTRTLTCEGGVELWRDDVKLQCDKMTAAFDQKGNITSATCSGNVRVTRTDLSARGELATYDGTRNQVELTGKPRTITSSRGNTVKASRIRIDLGTNELFIEGAEGVIAAEPPSAGKAP